MGDAPERLLQVKDYAIDIAAEELSHVFPRVCGYVGSSRAAAIISPVLRRWGGASGASGDEPMEQADDDAKTKLTPAGGKVKLDVSETPTIVLVDAF